jgi:DHA2 family multidrug resistance protein
MSRMNLEISPDQVIWPRAGLVVGLAIVFAPVNVAAYLYTPPLLRGAAVGLLSLLRNEGGSVGTSLAQTFHERRERAALQRSAILSVRGADRARGLRRLPQGR